MTKFIRNFSMWGITLEPVSALRVMFVEETNGNTLKKSKVHCFRCTYPHNYSLYWLILSFFIFLYFSDFPEAGINPKTCFLMFRISQNYMGMFLIKIRKHNFSWKFSIFLEYKSKSSYRYRYRYRFYSFKSVVHKKHLKTLKII